jgi:hypothetical protein
VPFIVITYRRRKSLQKRGQIYFPCHFTERVFPFRPYGESLSLVWPRESNQREGHPDIRVWPAARLPSLRCRSGGRRTRGIHAPLRLSPHPCGSSPCATPPLGLLTGTWAPRCLMVFLCAARIDRSHALRPLRVLRCRRLCDAERHGTGFHAERGNHRLLRTFRQRQTPLQEGERNRCVEG